METLRFSEQFQDYNRWKDQLCLELNRYQEWAVQHGTSSPEDRRRIQESIALLRSDQLTIAFVAEFSRGKSELINAIFFAEHGRRLLPSSAGRTTMCPTELLYDREQNQAYVKLLPIETRIEDLTIADLKEAASHWTTIELDTASPEQMEQALRAVVEVKQVPVSEAKRLGLGDDHQVQEEDREGTVPPGWVEIPRWRHAVISFPHPLLKQGLTILDTPGLNALGTEPELTLNMLPQAQAVVFVLGADTGVTRSDSDMWQHHLKGFCGGPHSGLVVVLNKIDMLWDELRDHESVEASIHTQQQNTAAILGVGSHYIFPVSAQKGLLAKIRNDPELLTRSRLLDLETFLSSHIMTVRRRIVLESIWHDIEHILHNSKAAISARLREAQAQLEQLHALTGEKRGLLLEMLKRTREEQTAYLKNVESFQSSRRVIGQQVRGMLESLNMDSIDRMIVDSRDEMLSRWTTIGLKGSMKLLFDRFHEAMREIQFQNEQTRRLVQATYKKFQEEHGFSVYTPKLFRIMKYSVELEKLNQEAEAFRKSPVATFTEQGYLTKKFFISIVSRTRDIFQRAGDEAEAWSREILNPLIKEIKEHKQRMENRLQVLRQVSQSKQSLDDNIKELTQRCTRLSSDLSALGEMESAITGEFAQFDAAPSMDEEPRQAAS